MNIAKLSKIDTSITIMRILACFLVICIHVWFTISVPVCRSTVLLQCFRADAVSIFWFIMGAFYFNTTYNKLMLRVWKKIVIPMLVVMFAIFYLDGFVFYGETLLDSIQHTASDYASFFRNLLLYWTTPVDHTGAYWYLFVYILVCIAFPVEQAFAAILDSSFEMTKYFLVLSYGILLLNDLSMNNFGGFENSRWNAFLPAWIIMMWGHIVYRNRDKIARRFHILTPLVLFVMLNMIRCEILLYQSSHYDNSSDCLLYWFSSFALLCVFSLYMFVYMVSNKIGHEVGENVRYSWKAVLNFVASYSFQIYLVHLIVIDMLAEHEIFKHLWENLSPHYQIFFAQLLFLLISAGVVFIISWMLNILVRYIWRILSRIGSVIYKSIST